MPHILTDQDVRGGMEALSQKLLGDASLWPQLVTLNALVPPYLTLDPVAAYGLPQDTEALSGAVSSGSSSFALSAPLQLWQPGDTVALAATTSSGIVSESGTVKSYDGTTLVLVSALQNPYPKGASVLSFPPTPIEPTQILMPGEVLYLPVTGQSTSFVLTQAGVTSDVFGSDALSPLSFQGGDIETVQGPSTLAQRLKTALLTEKGSMPNAPTFGSRLHQVTGAVYSRTEYLAWIRDALLALPEVENVTDVQVAMNGDQAAISAKVWVCTSKTPLVLLNEALVLPVYR